MDRNNYSVDRVRSPRWLDRSLQSSSHASLYGAEYQRSIINYVCNLCCLYRCWVISPTKTWTYSELAPISVYHSKLHFQMAPLRHDRTAKYVQNSDRIQVPGSPRSYPVFRPLVMDLTDKTPPQPGSAQESSYRLDRFPNGPTASPILSVLPRDSNTSHRRSLYLYPMKWNNPPADDERHLIDCGGCGHKSHKNQSDMNRFSKSTKLLSRHHKITKAPPRSIRDSDYIHTSDQALHHSDQGHRRFQDSDQDTPRNSMSGNSAGSRPYSIAGTTNSAFLSDSVSNLPPSASQGSSLFKPLSELWAEYEQAVAELEMLEQKHSRASIPTNTSTTYKAPTSQANELHNLKVKRFVDKIQYKKSENDCSKLSTKLAGFRTEDMYPSESYFFEEAFSRTVRGSSPYSTDYSGLYSSSPTDKGVQESSDPPSRHGGSSHSAHVSTASENLASTVVDSSI